MTTELKRRAQAPRQFLYGATLIHIEFDGRSFDLSLPGLDLVPESADEQVKLAVAEYLGEPSYRLDEYTVDRHSNGNLTVRPLSDVD
jgi:hypothetical protein